MLSAIPGAKQAIPDAIGPCSEQQEMRTQFLGKCLQSHNCFPSCDAPPWEIFPCRYKNNSEMTVQTCKPAPLVLVFESPNRRASWSTLCAEGRCPAPPMSGRASPTDLGSAPLASALTWEALSGKPRSTEKVNPAGLLRDTFYSIAYVIYVRYVLTQEATQHGAQDLGECGPSQMESGHLANGTAGIGCGATGKQKQNPASVQRTFKTGTPRHTHPEPRGTAGL